MTANEIRQKYFEFFKARGHVVIQSASLLPENDASTLFIGSGMQPLVPYLLGEKHPLGKRLANSQKSFRTEDIEEVGDNRHNTFFEMLGNWSLGDYFKKEQLPWFFEFLTDILHLDPSRLYVSCYGGNPEIGVPRDEESAKIWQEIFSKKNIIALSSDEPEQKGIKENERIFYYKDNKNWWSRSGVPAKMPAGEPGGPDSEVFYDLGESLGRHENSKWKNQPCHINCDCGRFIEIGNSVFMEYVKNEDSFAKLPQTNVDFGGGLERLVMVAQGKDNVYETDLFLNILKEISRLSGGRRYRENMKPFEIIADHLKSACFIIGDDRGISPSNTGQGYIARRLIRRAIRFGKLLGINNLSWTAGIASIIISDYQDVYAELARNRARIIKELEIEEEKFQKTIELGLKEFEKMRPKFNQVHSLPVKSVEYGFSGDDLFNLYSTYGFPIEMSIEELKKIYKEFNADKSVRIAELPKQDEERIRKQFHDSLQKHQDLSRTASAGMFKGGLADSSEQVTRLHTAAHLMLAALRKVLGDQVVQKGSNITAERLRFDFLHKEKMTDEQKAAVEAQVNSAIAKDLPITFSEMDLKEAKAVGAMGVFDSKYGEKVKVYTVGAGDEIYSKEICGGPHVERTGLLGSFKIQKEESSSAGIRRIKAVLE